VVQQCASADVGSALLDGFEELGFLFQYAIDGLLNQSGNVLACTFRKVAKAGFLIRRKVYLHKVPLFEANGRGSTPIEKQIYRRQSGFLRGQNAS
jgi:hypothetical protein